MKPGKRQIGNFTAIAASGMLFFVLLGFRLDLFSGGPGGKGIAVGELSGSETWMNILQKGRKIGYSHRRLVPKQDGYDLKDTTYMRINTMGMVQDLHMRTTAALFPDLTLSGFEFTLRSNLFDFKASGEVKDNRLTVDIGGRKTEFPMEDPLYLTGGIMDAAGRANLTVGESRTFSVFDPATLGRRPVKVRAEGEEFINVMGENRKTMRLSVDFMGSEQTAWIDETGSVVQEKGLMGITLKRVSQQEAFSELTLSPSQDLTRVVSVNSNVVLERPEDLSRLKLRITGIDEALFMAGGRQDYQGGILTITKEAVPARPGRTAENLKPYLFPTPFIESDHPDITQLVAGIVSPEDDNLEKVRKITKWVYDNIEKRPVLSVPSALETLNNRMGDCNEHAVLVAAMARAAGIPAQIEAGLVYLRGRFYYHAWNALYLDNWVTVDALMNQIPADVTHIRFVRGEPRQQIDLMSVIGSVRLKIISKS